MIAVTLVFAAPAAAANVAPNPGFEAGGGSCGVMPCEWTQTSGSVIAARDTTSWHSGLASLRFLNLSGEGDATVRSSCIPLAERTASEAASVWFRGVGAPEFLILFKIIRYSTATCTGVLPYSGIGLSASPSWQERSFSQRDSLRTAGSYQIEFATDCFDPTPGACAGPFDFFVDDVSLTPLPSTAVTVAELVAVRTVSGARLRWRTSSEVNIVGFHVYRQVGDKRIRLTRSPLPTRFAGTVRGQSYSFLDRDAPRRSKMRYWLQLVGKDGTRSWYGPAQAHP